MQFKVSRKFRSNLYLIVAIFYTIMFVLYFKGVESVFPVMMGTLVIAYFLDRYFMVIKEDE